MHRRTANRPRRSIVAAVVGSVATLAAVLLPGTASAGVPAWAPAGQAAVHPGALTSTEGGGRCTANFIFYNATDVFIGQAAHCAGLGGPTQTSGCSAQSKPLGTPVTISGASKPGALAYSSWLTMAKRGEKDSNACDFNDFALVKIDPADVGKVNPSMPFFGGPTGLADRPTTAGERILTYGNSPLRAGLSALSPKTGISLGDKADGWSHTCYTLSPGVPGDSGSGVMTSDGKALGVVSTLVLAPLAASNGVGDLRKELEYANAHGGLGTISLALGTTQFNPLLP